MKIVSSLKYFFMKKYSLLLPTKVTKSADLPLATLMTFEQHHAVMVFGLRWQTVLGGQSVTQAQRLATVARATHYTYERGSEAVGYSKLLKAKNTSNSYRYVSAAQSFANVYNQGLVCAVLSLNQHQHWFVAARDGCVLVNTDTVFTDIEQLNDYKSRMQIADAVSVTLSLHEFIVQCLDNPGLLKKLQSSPVKTSPKLFLVFFLVLSLALSHWVWQYYQRIQRVQKQSEDIAQRLSPEQVWGEYLRVLGQQYKGLDDQGFEKLSAELMMIPFSVQGWGLQNLSCQPKTKNWSCQANYKRLVAASSNQDFQSNVPKTWTLNWVPINTVLVSFEMTNVQSLSTLLDLSTLDTQNSEIMSSLQAYESVFQRTHISEAQPWQVPALQDQTISAKSSPSSISQRRMTIEGPLRSLSALNSNLLKHLSWQKITINAQPSVSSMTLKQSVIMMKIEGDIYAKNS